VIGLKRGTVQVVDHDPGWSAVFASERDVLQRTLADIDMDIQHVGSTAVSGLPAKPILDIAIGIQAADLIPTIVERFTEIGYLYRGDAGDDGGHLFVRELEPEIRSVHVHVVEINDRQWVNYLAFRKVLCEDEKVRNGYAELKLDLAKRFPNDRKSYTSAKDEFISRVLEEISHDNNDSVWL
jgi:GrpB-like predicted nucleotidyltransferase (UPF0157 family)